MQPLQFKEYSLMLDENVMTLSIHHGAHFEERQFLQCYEVKKAHYKDQKVGIKISRKDPNAFYSFDPMFLLKYQKLFLANAAWIVVISNKDTDYQNLEYIKQFTNVQCTAVQTEKEAARWVQQWQESTQK